MPTAAAKTFFRIVFSASEPVISSAKVGFVDIAAIVASLAKLLLAWSAVFCTVVVGVLETLGSRGGVRILPVSLRSRGERSQAFITTDSSEWMNPSAPIHARARHALARSTHGFIRNETR